jgi:type IV secretion system protein VirB11
MMDGQPSFLGAYLSSLAPILQREDLVEIATNPDGKVWIERKGGSRMGLVTDMQFDRALSVNLGQAIAVCSFLTKR